VVEIELLSNYKVKEFGFSLRQPWKDLIDGLKEGKNGASGTTSCCSVSSKMVLISGLTLFIMITYMTVVTNSLGLD
jgi:hypothetical protein